ncbi:Replication factor C large subunit [Dirofilaria immitis]
MTEPAKRSGNKTGQLKSATAKSKSDNQLNDKDARLVIQNENGNITTGQQRGGFRKLLMRISEKIGATEKTEYTKCFRDMCKEIDEYRDIAQQLISILQQDPRYLPRPPGKMEVQAPPQEDPFELLEMKLKITGDQMEFKASVN